MSASEGAADEISPSVRAIAELEQAQLTHPDLPGWIWEVAQRTADTVLSWSLPSVVGVAALLAPLLEHGLVAREDLAARYEMDALLLAERLLGWHRAHAASETGRERPAVYYSLQQRRLFRAAYLDLRSGLPFILLLLADHGARLGHPDVAAARLAAQSMAVFIPLAEMLGIWDLRRAWIDRSMELQFPAEYTRIADRWVVAGGKERAATLTDLEHRLAEALATAGIAGAAVRLRQIQPGVLLRRWQLQGGREESADQIVIDLLCDSDSECYRLLGVVHSLGKPVTPRFSERFADFIATPQSTGYRALRTAIIYRPPRDPEAPPSEGGKIVVDFRILTREHDRLNEWGVITAFHLAPEQYREAPAWWNRLDAVADKLHRRFKVAAEVSIPQFLEQFDIGSQSAPLYGFTPRGDVVLLDDGSTPIDFAYQIHKELSQHAARMEVNGQEVPYNYPLRNGDLVQIHYDPQFLGPDLSWLGFVGSVQARTAIRRALTSRARAVHIGRSQIEELLIKTVSRYAKEKQYRLTITTKRLDAFLLQVARMRGLPDLQKLYDEVAAGRIAAYSIVRRLISIELAGALVDPAGARLPYPLPQIRFCSECYPVPGEPLLAFERRQGNMTTGLMVHRQGNTQCPGVSQAGKQIAVRWAELGEHEYTPELIMFQVSGADRYQLLDEVLAAVYEEPSAHLYRVEAQAYSDSSADITLAVETDNLTRAGGIEDRIEGVPNVHQVLAFPASLGQRLALQAPVAKYQPNPYATQEVYDRWMFYDREEPIHQIRTWLAEPPPAPPLILHGQRRVGKSSLARYLMHTIVPQQGLALPVFVDLQALSGHDPQHIANLLVREVYAALRVPPPAPLAAEEAIPWLDRALHEAVVLLGTAHLLVMIDEFNVLLDQESGGRLDPLVFANLRAVLNARRDIHWMLIVQDTHYRDPQRWGNAGPLFQQTNVIGLELLDARWANKLILEPATRCGLVYQSADLPVRIHELTAGSPYLIQVLCYHLVDRVRRQQRTTITADDLRRATDLVSADGHRYFAHFTENLTGLRRVALAAVAHYGQSGDWVGLGTLDAQLQRKTKQLDSVGLRTALEGLERQGMLALRSHAGSWQARITMRLFHEWVGRSVDLDGALAEWQRQAR